MTIVQHNPLHPGIFIKQVYLEPNNIGSNELARQLKVSNGLISRLLNGKTTISPETAIKLSRVLGRSPESWLMMQDNYDLWQAKQNLDINDYQQLQFA